jgi:hypothetical protein
VVRLIDKVRICKCGQTGGAYINDIDAEYFGPCFPLGFANSSFVFALKAQPEEGMGQKFEAFVIPKKCPTMKKMKARK